MLTWSQLIIEEGGTVAADARLICDYTRPEDFEIYKRLRAEDKLDRSDEEDEMADFIVDEEEVDENGAPVRYLVHALFYIN